MLARYILEHVLVGVEATTMVYTLIVGTVALNSWKKLFGVGLIRANTTKEHFKRR